MKKVCVYCASSPKVNDIYFKATQRLAGYLVDAGAEVVFGGGSSGLMGTLADTVLEKGGKITGIMPHFMREVEWAHKQVQEFHFTTTMHERKEKLMQNTDALIALAGGSGTWEELLEAITLKRLGLYTKPIVILNTNNYYAPLKELFERSIEEHFMSEQHRHIWTFVDEPEEVIPAIQNAAEWNSGAIAFAAVK